MKVSVDPEVCQGHARCAAICPQIFALDEEGYPLIAVPEVPPELESKAREAMDNCPERAITIS